MHGAALVIDIQSIRRDPCLDDCCTEFAKNPGGQIIGRTICAIEDNFTTTELHVVNRTLCKFNIAPACIIQTMSLAQLIAPNIIRT